MICDSFFHIGVTHEICEDYALNRDNYAIISDGCSNGGGPSIDTDWGSRLLCKAAEQHLAKQYNIPLFCEAVLSTAQTQRSTFPNLTPQCLTATLLTIQKVNDEILGFMSGDGVIGARKRGTDEWEFTERSFESNAPYYLIYESSEEDRRQYLEIFSGESKLTTTVFNMKTGNVSFDSLIVPFDEKNPHFTKSYPIEQYDLVFIASDGVSSFTELVKTETSKFTNNIDVASVLNVLFKIPIKRPGFLKIQNQWAFKTKMKGSFQSLNWQNCDDVAVGAIWND